MKRIFLILSFALLMGCAKEQQPTELNLAITQHPIGGYNVRTITSTISGNIIGELVPINVTIEWWWENGYHANPQMVASENYIFNKSTLLTFTSNHNSRTGYYHLNYFWIKIKWTDNTGLHIIESNKAYCN